MKKKQISWPQNPTLLISLQPENCITFSTKVQGLLRIELTNSRVK